MIVWIDAQLSPDLAPWLCGTFGVEAIAVRDLGLRDASDAEIFRRARERDAVILTKDADFVRLLEIQGPPPRVLWVTCGNTSNARLQAILTTALPRARIVLESGEPLVEIHEAR